MHSKIVAAETHGKLKNSINYWTILYKKVNYFKLVLIKKKTESLDTNIIDARL